MHTKNRSILLFLAAVFSSVFVLLTLSFQGYTKRYALAEADKLAHDALLTHRAIHQYINKVSRPELFRLMNEKLLYDGYFSPKTLSFTYTARGIKDFLNQERAKDNLPPVYFKLASNNPRNEINRADAQESALLKQMNTDVLNKYQEVIKDAMGQVFLYIALPTKPVKKGCLRCHGDPQDAPKEMVEKYPKANGYYEKIGDIRALISIRIPLKSYIADGQYIANIFTSITFIALLAIYVLISYFIRRLDVQQQLILKKNKKLEDISVTDFLTQTYNRMGFMRFAKQALQQAKQQQQAFSVVMFDLDLFKHVNDQYGHDVGDSVLRDFAQLLRSNLQEHMIFARIGGEEFVMAIPGATASEGMNTAEAFRLKIYKHDFPEQITLSCSFGVAELSVDEGLSELITKADHALYQAKNNGRNQVCLYTDTAKT